jgi:hypothetical protein
MVTVTVVLPRSSTSPARTLALYCVNSGFLVVFVSHSSSTLSSCDFVHRVFAAVSLATVGFFRCESCICLAYHTQYVCYPQIPMYAPFLFILVHLYSCSFMAMCVHPFHSSIPRCPHGDQYIQLQTEFPGPPSQRGPREHRIRNLFGLFDCTYHTPWRHWQHHIKCWPWRRRS